jgi:hypothetical protein
MYYPNTIKKLRKIILDRFPHAEPLEGLDNIINHILWMLESLEKKEELQDNPWKSARWIGYILGRAEAEGLLDNKQSRELIRDDVKNGKD